MFQVGDIVQVIIVPKKYKQYDIVGATGIVKTVYSNNIRIHISSYYNEESEEGDFYFKENELDNFTRKENDMSIIELWEKRSIEKIDKEAEIKLMELLAEDEYTHDLILHMNVKQWIVVLVTAFMVVPVDWIRKTICKKGSN